MKNKLEKILKGIFLSSVGSLMANNGDQAISYNLSNLENNNDKKIEESKSNDNSQKYILKIHDDDSYLIAGHRSHRSHSSHRSHYSHRSSSSEAHTVAVHLLLEAHIEAPQLPEYTH